MCSSPFRLHVSISVPPAVDVFRLTFTSRWTDPESGAEHAVTFATNVPSARFDALDRVLNVAE